MPVRPRLAIAASLLGAACALPALAAPQPLALRLRDEVRVAQRPVSLADLVLAPADRAAGEALRRIDVSAVLGGAFVARLSREQIGRRLAADPVLGARPVAWDGASSVVIRLDSDTISAGALVAAAVDAAAAAAAAGVQGASFAAAAPVADLEVPRGCTRLRPRPLAMSAGRQPVWVDAMAGRTVCRSVLVTLGATLQRDSYVARRPLEQGARVQASDFELRSENVAALAAQAVAPQAGRQEWRLRRALRAGEVLTEAAVVAGKGVLSGDPVRLRTGAGPIAIETAGTALADAEPGQRLAVRPASGTASVTGRLDAAGIVYLE